ncbi:MAG: hypothetical protein V4642_11345 [Bacteroidota bacterium]
MNLYITSVIPSCPESSNIVQSQFCQSTIFKKQFAIMLHHSPMKKIPDKQE